MTSKTVENIEKFDVLLNEIKCFDFPTDSLLCNIRDSTNSSISSSIKTYTDVLVQKERFSEEEVESFLNKALEIFNMLVKLRGDQLKNYCEANHIFKVYEHALFSCDASEGENSEESDKKIEGEVAELKKKEMLCLIMKNKINEIDMLQTHCLNVFSKIGE